MRTKGCTRRSLLSFLALAGILFPGAAAGADLVAYDDALRNGFVDWSWATTRSLAQTGVVHTGTSAISFVPQAWQAVFLHRDLGIDTNAYDTLVLWVRGSGAGGQNLRIALTTGGSIAGNDGPLAGFVAGGTIPSSSWAKATIPFSSLGVSGGVFDGFWVQDATGATQATVYLDDISFLERTTPPPPPTVVSVTVDPNTGRRPISPLIYGVAHFNEAGNSELAYPARRWGGNATTRYNWQIDLQNRASDWFFFNIPNDVADPSRLPDGSTADLWIDSVKAHQGEPVLTVPTIGWTPKGSNPATDRVWTWGYSIAKYGAQETNECLVNGYPGCHADAGNGCTPSSSSGNCTWLSITPDPTDTSMAVTPAYFTAWMDHIAGRVGTAAAGGVKYLILDNEPMLWNSTHHDIHPAPVTYDELWQKSRDSAVAFKAKDPAVQVLGGAAWGWCEYFNSSLDSAPPTGACGPQPLGPLTDYGSHGNLFWLPYLLQQSAAYQAAHGVRILDYLDVHFYPQGNGIFSSGESAATAALRLRSLKGLYDPAYVDESWIGQPVMLIPRMKAWITQYAPGTKLAVNEYNFGDGTTGPSSALAQAEALAIFGREGVDMANRWVVPPAGSLIEDAFRFYLDYDGTGSKVSGDSVTTTSSDVDGVGAYTVRGSASLAFLLFNKDTVDRQVNVTVAGGCTGTANLYRFSGSARLGNVGTAAAGTAPCLALTLPARSATLALLPATFACTPPATPSIQAPAEVAPSSGGWQASVADHAGSTYLWSIGNGTITSAGTSARVFFTAGAGGTVTLHVTETIVATGCASATATATIPTTSAPAAGFTPLTPCRLLDTRNATGPDAAAPIVAANETRTFDVTGKCGVPASARALSINLTVTQSTATGELVLYRGGLAAAPTASSISFGSGRTRANNGILELDRSGSGTLQLLNRSSGGVHVVLDVNGFFQ